MCFVSLKLIISLHLTEAVRSKLVAMKVANPSCRFRLEVNGLTREKVRTSQRSEQGLKAPTEYFVEADVYTKQTGKTISESDVIWEEIDGVWKQGVTRLNFDLVWLVVVCF